MPTPILVLDETSGLQTSGAGFTVHDVLASALPDRFKTALAAAGAPSTGAMGAATTPAQVVSFGDNVTDVGWTTASGGALVGVASNLLTLDGRMIYLYTSSTDNNVVYGRVGNDTDGLGPDAPSANASGAIAFALFLDTGVTTGPGDADATGASVWMVQFQPMRHPDGTDANDVVYLQDVLYVTSNSSEEFSLEGAPSGQNLFLMFADGAPEPGDTAIVVTGRNPNAGDTVNTGQGGGGTTLGTNNQMIDPGEGMYFSFVTLSAASQGVTVPNLDQTEADLAGNIVFDDYKEATEASFSLVQLQPPKQTALRLTAINNDANEQGQAFIDGLAPDTAELVNISAVRVVRTAKNGNTSTVYDGTEANPGSGGAVTVNYAGKTAVVSGLMQGDRVFYETDGGHDRLLVENTGSGKANASFDIGGFKLESTSATTTLLDPVAILDDGLAASTETLAGAVDDEGLTGGIAGGTGDIDGVATSATGNVSTLFTAGVDVPLAYSLATDTGSLPSLSSGGNAISYGVASAAGVHTLTATAGGNTIFTFELTSSTGAYTFALSRPIDHPSLDGAAGDDEENDVTIDLSSLLRASDGDTDSVAAASQALVITVDDDTPTASTSQAGGTVDEEGVAGGIAGGEGDVGGQALSATGSVVALFNPGADGIAGYGLSTTTTGLPTLRSGGTLVTYEVTSAAGVHTLTASAGTDTVFTFELTQGTGAYTFALSQPLDHASLDGLAGDNTENDLAIDLSAILRATDKDGDTTAAAANALVITVDDDAPVAFTPDSITLTNTGTAQGTEDLNGALSVGADGLGSVVFVDQVVADNYLRDTNGNLLQSGGENIVLSGFGTGTLTGKTETGNATVFTVALDTALDEYTVSFSRAIDDGGGIDFLGAAPVRSGNPTYNLINDVDGTTLDLLFSGGDAADGLPAAHSVNVSTQGAGTDNQSMNAGELLRIDFVTGASLAGSPSGSDFNLGTHEEVNGFSFVLTQNTPSGTNGTVYVRAVDADGDKDLVTDLDPQDVVDTITQVTVNGLVVFGTGAAPRTINGQTVTAHAYDGGVVIMNLNEGASGDAVGLDDPVIQVSTATGFNRIEVGNYAGVDTGSGALPGTSFDIAPAGVDQAVQGDPFRFELPVQMSDYDGDLGPVAQIGIDIDPVVV